MSSPPIRKLLTRPDYLIAYGLGSGLVPKAPGTAGSAIALLIFIPLSVLPIVFQLLVIAASFGLGVYVADRVSAELGSKDPSEIVWDEFVGMWIALLWLPEGWIWYPIAFVLFRIFDIAKPWPVSLVDDRLEGGMGIMLDDVIAALYALALLQVGAYLLTVYL